MAPSLPPDSPPAEAHAAALADAYKLGFEEQRELVLKIILSWNERTLREGTDYILDKLDAFKLNSLAGNLEYVASDPRLWRKHWEASGWKTSREEEQLLLEGKLSHVALFTHRLQLERNWLKGDYYVHTLIGHTDGITGVHMSHNRLATCSHDCSAKIWNLETGQNACTVPHRSDVTCVKLHEGTLITGCLDGTLTVWSVDGAQVKSNHVFRDNTTGSFDNAVRLYDIRQGKLMRTFRGHVNSVLAVAFDSDAIVSGSEDTTVRVWSLKVPQDTAILEGHDGAVTCCEFNQTHIVTASCDKTICVWSRADKVLLHTLVGHQAAIHALAFGDGKIVSGAGNDSIKIWDFKTGQCLHTLEEHKSPVTCLIFDHQKIISGAGDPDIKIINFGDPSAVHGKVAACLPSVRKRRANSLSGNFSITMSTTA